MYYEIGKWLCGVLWFGYGVISSIARHGNKPREESVNLLMS